MLRFFGDEIKSQSMQLEWLETNGLGGYASGTIAGIRTRRYHGLLISALNPPTNRTLLLASVDETLESNDEKIFLGVHLFRDGTISPDGRKWLSEFNLDWCPQWIYEAPIATVTKRIFMPHLLNAVTIRYFVQSPNLVVFSVRFFATNRDHHWVTKPFIPFAIKTTSQSVIVSAEPYSSTVIHITHNGDLFKPECLWWHNFWLPIEMERGLEDTESLFCVGTIIKVIDRCGHLDIIASVEPIEPIDAPNLEASERKRREKLAGQKNSPLVQLLNRATDSFICLRSSSGSRTIVAGYPWFTDWGRDALISITGLALVTERFAVAREILLTFARQVHQGMVPNFFPESNALPAYNTVDASLWFILAVYRYLRYTRDWEGLKRYFFEPLKDILEKYLSGTYYGICADHEDGLLSWSDKNEALTWMDAKVFGKPVTHRVGKPVEINALWCNALKIFARLAEQLKDTKIATKISDWAKLAQDNFEQKFWNDRQKCLFDVIDPDGKADPSTRCNQLLALALPFRLLQPERELQVLLKIEEKLLTFYGLRSLSLEDPNYIGLYVGPPEKRDAIYHQGTVWPWWWGAYADAVAQVEGNLAVQQKVRPKLMSFLNRHLRQACVGQISEIFDGNPPHQPRGCFAQAWSLAEVLRAFVERVNEQLPPSLWDER